MVDAPTMRRDLAEMARKDPKSRSALAKVAERLCIAGGRKWSEFYDDEIERFYRYTLGGEVLPDEVPGEVATPGAEPEMRAAEVDARLDDLEF